MQVTFVALDKTRWSFGQRPSVCLCCQSSGLVGPGPSSAAWSIGLGRRRFRGANGPCSLRVDALLGPVHSSAPLEALRAVCPDRDAASMRLSLQRLQTPSFCHCASIPPNSLLMLHTNSTPTPTGSGDATPPFLSGGGARPLNLHPRLVPPTFTSALSPLVETPFRIDWLFPRQSPF